MKITILDGQGGGLGRALVKKIKETLPCVLYAVGTNSAATAAMLSAGADFGATGESAVIFACKTSDVIIAPLGAAMPYSILGEISPAMSEALCLSGAHKIYLPYQKGCMELVGLSELALGALISLAVDRLQQYISVEEAVDPSTASR